jgi:hypothetical protein
LVGDVTTVLTRCSVLLQDAASQGYFLDGLAMHPLGEGEVRQPHLALMCVAVVRLGLCTLEADTTAVLVGFNKPVLDDLQL